MKCLLQNNPNHFQCSDMQGLMSIQGSFRLEDHDQEILVFKDHIDIDGRRVGFQRHDGVTHIGGSFWLSSIATMLIMGEYLKNSESLKILEIGAGIALTSQYLQSAYPLCHVTVSDLDTDILPECLNTKCIDWDNLDSMDTEKYDVVIASDCIYRNTMHGVLDCVIKYLKPQGKVFVVNALRESVDEFGYAITEYVDNCEFTNIRLIYNNEYYTDLIAVLPSMSAT